TGAGCVGAGWGNGRAIAVRLAEEGAKVLAVDRDHARLDETLDLAGDARASITPWLCDVTSSESVAAMAAACMRTYGTIDILVNNVGGSAAGGPVELAEEVWDSQVDINLKSVFRSEEHTSELQSRFDLVCRLLLEKKKIRSNTAWRAAADEGGSRSFRSGS